jgi:hypothetical protein
MALIKLIDSGSFFKDESTINIIHSSSVKELVKQAADSRIQEYVSSIKSEPDKIYVHILAMGAGEYFGANRNSDYFPEHNLIDCYKTFETSPAHIFRNHINKDPKKAIGQVVFAIYNERMHRVEVIAWIDKEKGSDIIERLERGDFPATSMACRTPHDVCSICGNKAHTRQEYCEHLATQLGKIYPDGRKVMALNVAPLKFFDMSIVVRPADVTSSILQKVANIEDTVIGSVDAAIADELSDELHTKQATLKKLSEFVKEVDGIIAGCSDTIGPMLAKVKDPDYATIDVLKQFKLPDVLSTMAHLGISPSIAYLAELIARKTVGDHMAGVGSLVASLVNEVGHENLELPTEEEFLVHEPNYMVSTVLNPSLAMSSLLPEYVEKRAAEYSNVGYIGNGPHVEPTPYEVFKRNNLGKDEQSSLMRMLHIVLAIGGAAVAAKWYITRSIEAKSKSLASTSYNSPVKIILVKSASDYKLTYELAKMAMVKVFKKV